MATYFYQTNLGAIAEGPASCIIVSSLHFGYSQPLWPLPFWKRPYLHLNDWHVNDPRYDQLWTTVRRLTSEDKDVAFMLGGAGGAFTQLFAAYDTFFPMLETFLKSYGITHLVLDVEERTRLSDVLKLVRDLKAAMPDLRLSFAPVLSEVLDPTVPGAFSGFCYQDLWNAVGTSLYRVYVQMYGGTFTSGNFSQLVNACTLDPQKIVPGFQSGDCSQPHQFDQAMSELTSMATFARQKHFKIGGCFVWEYFDAPPNGQQNPTTWADRVKAALSAG